MVDTTYNTKNYFEQNVDGNNTFVVGGEMEAPGNITSTGVITSTGNVVLDGDLTTTTIDPLYNQLSGGARNYLGDYILKHIVGTAMKIEGINLIYSSAGFSAVLAAPNKGNHMTIKMQKISSDITFTVTGSSVFQNGTETYTTATIAPMVSDDDFAILELVCHVGGSWNNWEIIQLKNVVMS